MISKNIFTAIFLTGTILASPSFAQEAPETAAEKPAEAAAAPVAAKPAASAQSSDFTIIKIGSDEIKNSEVQDVWKNLFTGDTAPDFASFDENIRQNVLRGMVSERLIAQEAVKAGYDKNAEVLKKIEAMKQQVVMQSFIEDKAKNLVAEKDVKALYNQKAKEAKGLEEVKARHILVANEDEAKKIAEEIKKGGDFDKIAKEKSTDKGSGAQGGDLGWFSKERMVPEFADAAFKLKKGEVSEPVKSAFGWHIIKLEDRRPLAFASYDDMKESLQAELTNKSVQTYVEGLLKKADIKYYGADGSEKPFSRSLAPAAGGEKQ
ncbi:MAG: peptidylprolyl isomerase [Alphaproteobacteria bacterium]